LLFIVCVSTLCLFVVYSVCQHSVCRCRVSMEDKACAAVVARVLRGRVHNVVARVLQRKVMQSLVMLYLCICATVCVYVVCGLVVYLIV